MPTTAASSMKTEICEQPPDMNLRQPRTPVAADDGWQDTSVLLVALRSGKLLVWFDAILLVDALPSRVRC